MYIKILLIGIMCLCVLSTSFCTSKNKYLSSRDPSTVTSCDKIVKDSTREVTKYGTLIVKSDICVNSDSADVFLEVGAECSGEKDGEVITQALTREPIKITSIDLEEWIEVNQGIVTIKYQPYSDEATVWKKTAGAEIAPNPAVAREFNMQLICDYLRDPS